MVFPRFSPYSFWNYRETCAVVGKRYSAAPLGLITAAALLPSPWRVRLVDRNIEELSDSDIAWADMVMIGSMLSQQEDTKRVIALVHAHDKPVVLGGPDVTCSPDIFPEVEFRIIGEAEDIMADFVAAWNRGDKCGLFSAQAFPDLKDSPLPRFDLLKLQHYMHVGVQHSRGCPYNCEFCNIISLNGRVPRLKSDRQMFRELDALYALGYRGHVDFVDDNFIGNPQTVRPFLTALADWNQKRGHPFAFSTEASLNLADNDEILDLLRKCGFFAVFIGIETPDARTLLSVHKKQNTGRDMAASILKIHQAGIIVNAGFIVGFDAETESVAPAMIRCIEETAIPVCMVGLLYALPDTQLSHRLQQEGRLHPETGYLGRDDASDQCTSGLNYETSRPRTDILRDYQSILKTIYHPVSFFGRVSRTARVLGPPQDRLPDMLPRLWADVRSLLRISWRLGIVDRKVRGPYWKALIDCLFHNPPAFRTVITFSALYLHLGPFAGYLDALLGDQIREAPFLGVKNLPPSDPATAQRGSGSRSGFQRECAE